MGSCAGANCRCAGALRGLPLADRGIVHVIVILGRAEPRRGCIVLELAGDARFDSSVLAAAVGCTHRDREVTFETVCQSG